ncbi:MAG: barstar family protein [Alkalibacterium sp.]|nr:barstar family protein [Alkalibacterium sp.]
MRLVKLNGKLMTSKETAHAILQEQLRIEGYFGHNLDALYDVLTAQKQDMEIMLFYKSDLETNLGRYAELLISTLKEAAVSNTHIAFKII